MPMGLTAVQFFAVGAPLRAFPPPGILSRSSRSWGLLSPPSGLPQMSPPPETSSDHPGGARRHRPGPLLPCPPQQLLRPGLLALAVLRPETARVAEVSLSLSFLIWTLRVTSPPPRAGVRTAGSSAGNVPPRCQHGPGWGFGHKWSLLPCRPGSSGSGGPRGSCRCTCTWRGLSPGAQPWSGDSGLQAPAQGPPPRRGSGRKRVTPAAAARGAMATQPSLGLLSQDLRGLSERGPFPAAFTQAAGS